MVELFGKVSVDWLGKRKLFIGISAALLLIGLISLASKGQFRYGVDFKGGTIVTVRFMEKPDIERIRQALRDGGAPNTQPQEVVGTNDILIEYGEEAGAADTTADPSKGREVIESALNRVYAGKYETRSATSIGAKVGADLRRQAVLATLYALGGILVYIAFRFEWIYGAAAVFAVFHDTLVTLGLFSLFNRPINLTVIAALLTLVGYSVNDTIVVFDRIRENLRTRRRDDLQAVMNDSINQTLSRTILTSGLTFITVMALFVFGGEIISHFAFAMVIGIIVGTYSSIAMAAPLVLIYSKARGQMALPAASARRPGPAKVPRPVKAK